MKRSCFNIYEIILKMNIKKHEKFHVITIIELYTHAI